MNISYAHIICTYLMYISDTHIICTYHIQVMKDCVSASVKGAIIISAGFKETGEEGAKLEKEIMDIARDGNIRVVGPNCLGVMVSLWFEILNISCVNF